ncbi:MAG TPA: phospho-N-acetylmuramoyl-pentapeptide-transferase [Actinomycetota bacterium]|nr:phospho-N-acetylmuramoyl-pentapeptide-transferase [Actinomycetota bacterium]
MIWILVAGGVGLAVTLLGTPLAIRAFTLWGWGQRIREDGPHTHLEKMGTPTMGGVVILTGLLLAYLATRFRNDVNSAGLPVVLVAVGLGAVGFLDDFMKVRNRRSLGLTKLQKFAGTALVSLAFGMIVSRSTDETGISTSLSFVRPTAFALGVAFLVWVFLVLTASSHAVNLTDGLDGLAAGSSTLVCAAYVFIAFWQFRHPCEGGEVLGASGCYAVNGAAMLDVAIVAAGMMGALAGFLWWNAAPAKIFMGDTGSLAIGGLFGALAVATNSQLLLVILGGLFVMETMSVIAQVISFRGFGRRIFRMSPIHHHFELAGWPEFTVIVRFWIVAGLCVAVGLGLYYADFLNQGGLD